MSNYLETALSLMLIFFIFSIIAYIVQEIIAVNLEYRGNYLYKSLAQILDKKIIQVSRYSKTNMVTEDVPKTKLLYAHGQIALLSQTLKEGKTSLPSYIPATNFALAVMDLVSKDIPGTDTPGNLFDKVKYGLKDFSASDGDVFVVLKDLLAVSSDISVFQQKIENWYNDYMDRVTGWYKAHTVVTLRLIALGVTLFFNVNVIRLTKEIFSNGQLRGTLAGMAENVTANQHQLDTYYNQGSKATIDSIDAANKKLLDSATSPVEKAAVEKRTSDAKAAAILSYSSNRKSAIDTLYNQIHKTGLPLGWDSQAVDSILVTKENGKWDGDTIIGILWCLMGWLIAAGCISMGAPFWFDMMVKLVNVRRSGIVPAVDTTKK